jgi:predicted alpha/beta-hydrolase family hydrolase
LIFFGYPLHPPGKPQQRRDAHLPKIRVPMLFLHGTRDPFGSPDEMTALTGALQRAELHVVDGGDHSLTRRSRKAGPDPLLVSALDAAALWIHAQVNGAMRQ